MISDMTRTVDKIVAASRLPLSIVIIGVGGADFTNMVVGLDVYGNKNSFYHEKCVHACCIWVV